MAVALTLSGCMFLRLSRVLVQMKEPSRFLDANLTGKSFHGKLREPVVYLADIEAIVGLKAQKRDDHWCFEFRKLGPSDREPWYFLVWTHEKGRVTAFELPPRVTTILGNPWVMSGIAAIGRAEVSIRQRRVFLKVEEVLTVAQVLELLGQPIETEPKRWVYRFGSPDQPMVLELQMAPTGAEHLLMSSGKLSAYFTFQSAKEGGP